MRLTSRSLARTTLRDDSDADEEVVERCHTLPTQPASAAALRGLGRGLESNRFFSLATDSEDEEGERRTTFDEDSCSDTVSLVGRRNPRRLRLRWSEGSPCREQETRVDTPDSHDERGKRCSATVAGQSWGSVGPTLRVMCPTEGDSSVRCGTMTLIQKFRQHSLC